jgi:hypothetical protein
VVFPRASGLEEDQRSMKALDAACARNHRPPGRGSWGGRRMRVITSLESCWRGGCLPEGNCDCVVMRSGGGMGGPFGGTHDGGGHSALHHARHMSPQASSARDSTKRDVWWGGATIFREEVVSSGRWVNFRTAESRSLAHRHKHPVLPSRMLP